MVVNLKQSTWATVWSANWTIHLIHKCHSYLKVQKRGKLWLFQSGYLGNIMKMSKSITSKKWLTVFVASDKIQVFKWKFKFWKACIHHHELASFLTVKGFSNRLGGATNKRDFFILNDEMCEHLKSYEPIFSNVWCYRIMHDKIIHSTCKMMRKKNGAGGIGLPWLHTILQGYSNQKASWDNVIMLR